MTQPLLFTPGPLTTSQTVKEAMQVDLGSRDGRFSQVVREIRQELVRLAGGSLPAWVSMPSHGSGTVAVESALASLVPENGKLLVLANGAYGRRMADSARVHRLPLTVATVPETEAVSAARVRAELERDAAITH